MEGSGDYKVFFLSKTDETNAIIFLSKLLQITPCKSKEVVFEGQCSRIDSKEQKRCY